MLRLCIDFVHEMVHLGIQRSIVERFTLTHWEKERVDTYLRRERAGRPAGRHPGVREAVSPLMLVSNFLHGGPE